MILLPTEMVRAQVVVLFVFAVGTIIANAQGEGVVKGSTCKASTNFGSCVKCANGAECCDNEICCSGGSFCCPNNATCCNDTCCDDRTQSCCPDPKHGGVCCEKELTYCCPPVSTSFFLYRFQTLTMGHDFRETDFRLGAVLVGTYAVTQADMGAVILAP